MKLVISGGDSFTFGAELPDDNGGDVGKPPSKLSWANLVSEKLNCKHINVASSGRGNSFICRRVLYNLYEALETIDPKDIFVQVMWTFVARREFKLLDGTLRGQMYKNDPEWLSLDPYTVEDESKSEWFLKVDPSAPNYKNTKDSLKRKYNLYKDAGIVDFGKHWHKIISDEDDTYSSLKDILLLQNTLKNYNIKYMFTYVGYHTPEQLFNYKSNMYVEKLRKFIDKKAWFHFPGEWSKSKYIGFHDWGLLNHYEYATSHPLEKAHSDAAELIYNHIRTL